MKHHNKMKTEIEQRLADNTWPSQISERVLLAHKKNRRQRHFLTAISLATAASLVIAITTVLHKPQAIKKAPSISYLELGYDANLADDDIDELINP